MYTYVGEKIIHFVSIYSEKVVYLNGKQKDKQGIVTNYFKLYSYSPRHHH